MPKWIEPRAVEVPRDLLASVGGQEFVATALVRRGITDAAVARAFLDPRQYGPTPAEELPELIRGAERIEEAIRREERVLVWGDFDVDGQTATALLVTGLRALGGRVTYHIPHRQQEGHGIRTEVFGDILREGIGLVVTCDTGTTEHEALEMARHRGVDVVVTDHHVPSTERPPAYALINPRLLPPGHPLKELPGVGVAYKLIEYLCQRAGRKAVAEEQLDLVALGIVADVATQIGDVRYLLQRGLQVIRAGQRVGLRAIIASAGLSSEGITEEHIGFALAPRLNALGRLGDATEAVELLITTDITRARILAARLEGLNAQRQLLTKQIFDAARALIDRDPSLLEHHALVLAHPSWPGGVVGIVAGRLAEFYGKPTLLISMPPGELARGSARSVPGCDIIAAIRANAEMLRGFGGHPMAAGVVLDPRRIDEFRLALSRTIAEQCGEELPERELPIDAYVGLEELSLGLVAQIDRLAPFGPGNPPVVLATRALQIVDHALIGRADEHRRVVVQDEAERKQTVLWWGGAIQSLPEGVFDLAYTVRATDYRGARRLQVEWIDARPREVPTIPLVVALPKPTMVDFRSVLDAEKALREILAADEAVVWSEGLDQGAVPGVTRVELGPTEQLVVWTCPPAAAVLREALQRTGAHTVYLFAMRAGLDRPKPFLSRLAGMVKYALRERDGIVQLERAAAALGHRVETVRKGIAYLAARGQVRIVAEGEEEIELVPDRHAPREDILVLQAELDALLVETEAYRRYYQEAEVDYLL